MKALFFSKTIKARILKYNFCIICVIAVIFSVSSYATANKKTVEIARNSLVFHVESISFRYEMAYEEMLNIVLSCTERSAFNLAQMGSLSTPEEKRAGIISHPGRRRLMDAAVFIILSYPFLMIRRSSCFSNRIRICINNPNSSFFHKYGRFALPLIIRITRMYY